MHCIKIGQKALSFDKQCVNKNAFLKNKRLISIDRVEIKRIVLSKRDLYGKKCSFTYFIGYISESNFFLVPLCVKLSQMNKYFKYFDNNNKYMNLLVHNNKLLKNTMQYGIKLVIYQKKI